MRKGDCTSNQWLSQVIQWRILKTKIVFQELHGIFRSLRAGNGYGRCIVIQWELCLICFMIVASLLKGLNFNICGAARCIQVPIFTCQDSSRTGLTWPSLMCVVVITATFCLQDWWWKLRQYLHLETFCDFHFPLLVFHSWYACAW